MVQETNNFDISAPAMEAFFLDRLAFSRCLDLQRRLIEEVGRRDDGQIVLLLCEHHDIITVGRGGSPGDVNRQSQVLKSREIEVIYANRGGGCLLNCPGQLAIYPLVPLAWHGFTVGDFLDRLQVGIIETLDDLGILRAYPARQARYLGADRTIGGRGSGRAKLGYVLRGVFECRSAPGTVPGGRVRCGGSYTA